MILDTGVRCPDMMGINLFPFFTSTDYNELYNGSGWNGPVPSLTSSTYSGASGMFGPGTFYPGTGNLDQWTRAYWCVKAWLLTVKLYRVMDAGLVECNDFGIPISVFSYCTIGGFGGDVGSINTAEIFTKILTTQDYCSYNSTSYNQDNPSICPPVGEPNFNSNSICTPINPIQKFNDLFVRDRYFSWKPTEEDVKNFESGQYNKVATAYRYDFTQFRVLTTPLFDCGLLPSYDSAKSIFSLSLMNPDILTYSGSCLRTGASSKPEIDSNNPFGLNGISGEALTNKWGQVTGYGLTQKPSGFSAPCMFDLGTGIGALNISENTSGANFMPFAYFQLRLKNNQSSTSLCPINDTISSVITRQNQKVCGSFSIYDQPLSGDFGVANRVSRRIMQIPLFGSTTAQQLFAEVSIEPTAFWVDSSGNANY